MTVAYDIKTENCPYCGTVCDADFVDVGVGMCQCGPYHCENCGASQIGIYDEPRLLTVEEEKTNWYKPHSDPGSSANVIGGRIVSHRQMKETYRQEFKDNPLWSDKTYVDDWRKEIRKLNQQSI